MPCRHTIDRLQDLAGRVDRLSPNHRDPERFYFDRSEIADELRRMAQQPAETRRSNRT